MALPVIHSLGTVFIPVDESRHKVEGAGDGSRVELSPMIALALHGDFSTGLFDWL